VVGGAFCAAGLPANGAGAAPASTGAGVSPKNVAGPARTEPASYCAFSPDSKSYDGGCACAREATVARSASTIETFIV
jgi:hypothetical protein